MSGQMARSAPRTPFGRPGMPGAHPWHLRFQLVRKTATICASSGFIRGMPGETCRKPADLRMHRIHIEYIRSAKEG